MQAIVVVDNNWGIGKNNDLLFHLPEDMKHFRATTLNKIVVMGSNTLKSFPGAKPLPKRTNIVLWPDGEDRDDCVVVGSLDALSAELKKYPTEDVYIIGGAMFYRTMLPYCSRVIVTKVDTDGGAQVFFENLDALENWKMTSQSEPVKDGEYELKFTVYENSSPKAF